MSGVYILFALFSFLVGISVGSFLNCVVFRLEGGQRMSGRSFCDNCSHKLSWKNLIPVLSFFFQKGKCQYCQKGISWNHPLIEIVTGIVFLLVFIFNFPLGDFVSIAVSLQSSLTLLFYWYVVSSLMIIFLYDLKHYIIPDKVLIPLIVITALHSFFILSSGSIIRFLGIFLLAGFIFFAFFFAIFFFSKGQWMGFGDVKFVFFMGLLLGPEKSLFSIFTASFLGAVMGIILIMMRKKSMKDKIPFGPFLAFGTFLAMIIGNGVTAFLFSI